MESSTRCAASASGVVTVTSTPPMPRPPTWLGVGQPSPVWDTTGHSKSSRLSISWKLRPYVEPGSHRMRLATVPGRSTRGVPIEPPFAHQSLRLPYSHVSGTCTVTPCQLSHR
jgi:hypothetical protein